MSGYTNNTVLPRPPRLMPSGAGFTYDMKELVRWLQRLYLILGMPNTVNSNINLFQAIDDLGIEIASNTDVVQQHDIHTLSDRIEDLSNSLQMITDRQNEIMALQKKIADIQTEIDMGA